MDLSQGSDSAVVSGTRKFRTPNRILVRSFRISRDTWKEKHQLVQAKLEKERQRSAELGQSRDRWREKFDASTSQFKAAQSLAQQLQTQLEQAQQRIAQLIAEPASQKKC